MVSHDRAQVSQHVVSRQLSGSAAELFPVVI